jgi:ATP-binding cassette, subfamily B, bacterial
MNIPLREYWDLLEKYIRPQRGRFTLLALMLLGSIGLQVINPQIIRSFIDGALAGEELNRLLIPAVMFISIALLQQGVSVGVVYLGEKVAWIATNALRSDLARHCLHLDMGFHNKHTPGELIERIDGDVTEMANFFSQFVVILVGNILLLIGILFALFREDWRTGLAFLIFSAAALGALSLVRGIAVPHQKAMRQAEAEMYGFIEEQLASTEDVRASGAVEHSLRELQTLQRNIMIHDRKSNKKNWWINNVTGGMSTLAYLMAIGAGYLLFTGGSITVGTVYMFIHYVGLLEQPLWTLTHQVESFQKIGACVERLSELRGLISNVVDGADETSPAHAAASGGNGKIAALPDGPLGLAFQGVSFSYNTEDTVLSSLDFRLAPGSVLGLLGRTGSGKTTLTRLIFRLYDPSAGQILLEGMDLKKVRLEDLRRHVAIVTQDVQLFRASVRDNLTFFDRDISDAQILDAIESLELGEWFRSLPQGLDTMLDAGGHSLSAGEAQLLAFTRIFLRSPGLVILDEASSRLDPVTEQHIERAINRLLKDRTAIIIAHRLHTVHRADQVMILDEGQICEHGQRDTLAQDPDSRFYSLLKTGLEEVLV